jgi:exopolysaccharide biosynthesis polyprenyl glycosylphosphotransferase
VLSAVLVDVSVIATAVVGDLTLSRLNHNMVPTLWAALGAPIILAVLAFRGRYQVRIRSSLLDQITPTATATLIATATILTLQAVIEGGSIAVGPGARFWALTSTFLVAGRIGLISAGQKTRDREAGIPTLIVGAGRVGRIVAKRLRTHPEVGLNPIGFLDKEPAPTDGPGPILPVLGASWDLEQVVEDYGVEYVIVSFSTAPTSVLLNLVRRCEQLGVAVALVPRLFETVPRRLRVEHLGGLPLLQVKAADPRGWQFHLKHVLDRVIAALMLPVVAPVLLLAAAAVWLSLGRPILFRQKRVGRDGRVFDMLKLRSMRDTGDVDGTWILSEEVALDAAADIAPGGVEGTDRRTRVGAFLRRTSLDELPQILNVVRGEMSFVGPRPERPEFARLFEENVYRYGERHRVKSGITGWAQVNGLRGKTSIGDRAEWDNYYIENWSFRLDFRILLLTLRAVLRPAGVE